jgi:hypothetical protein
MRVESRSAPPADPKKTTSIPALRSRLVSVLAKPSTDVPFSTSTVVLISSPGMRREGMGVLSDRNNQ